MLKERNIYNYLDFKSGFISNMFTLKYCIPNEWMNKMVDLDMSLNETKYFRSNVFIAKWQRKETGRITTK